MAALITILVVACVALAVGCGFLAWLWLEQKHTIAWLSRSLVEVLEERRSDPRQRLRWLRAVDSGDVRELPVPEEPDR